MEKGMKVLLSLAAILCAGVIITTGLADINVQSPTSDSKSSKRQSVQSEKESEIDTEAIELEKVELRIYENTIQPDTSSGTFLQSKLVEHDGKLYYSFGNTCVIEMNLDGSNKREVTGGIDDKTDYLLVTDQYIYVRCDDYNIKQYTFDGEFVGTIGQVLNWGVVCDWYFHDGCLYFQGMNNDDEWYRGLFRIHTGDGDYPECVTENCCNYDAQIYFYEDTIYFFDRDMNYCSIKENGSGETILRECEGELLDSYTFEGAETAVLLNGAYAGNWLYYCKKDEKTYSKLNLETMEEESTSWKSPDKGKIGTLIGEDTISYRTIEDKGNYIKGYQISTDKENTLKEYITKLPSGLMEAQNCQLFRVPGATRIYYTVEIEGTLEAYSVSADGREEEKLDALAEDVPAYIPEAWYQ
ncbi:hypothetical protein ACQRBN_03950 [Bariatricus sp. SGI.154]|uniref:hypothetical protein n=1 Tax=Bariatricus sp. SGI.154 TaxID=3420549 RepID=UPI003D08B52E